MQYPACLPADQLMPFSGRGVNGRLCWNLPFASRQSTGRNALDFAHFRSVSRCPKAADPRTVRPPGASIKPLRSEEHTSELQSLMRISYAVFCLKKKKTNTNNDNTAHAYPMIHL